MPRRPTATAARHVLDGSAILCAVLLLVGLAASALIRSGYSADEEITAVLARTTARTGLPLLPSHVFYNRGLPYTYAAAASGAVLGHSLVAYRVASLVAGIVGVGFAFALGRDRGSRAHAYTGAFLLAGLPAYASASVFARYYSTLAASVLVVLWLFARRKDDGSSDWRYLCGVAFANALHPLGLLLAGLPMVTSLLRSADRRLRRLAVRAVAIAAGTQIVGYSLHLISIAVTGTRPTTETAVYSLMRPPVPASVYTIATAPALWWVAGTLLFTAIAWRLAARHDAPDRLVLGIAALLALGFQVGALVLLVGVVALVAPRRAVGLLVPAGVLLGTAVVWWPAQMALHTSTAYSPALALALSVGAASYPFHAMRELAAWHPALTAAALGGLVAATVSADPMSRLVRSVGVLGLLTLSAYDVAGVPLYERYLLVPLVLVVVCAAHGAVQSVRLLGGTDLSRTAGLPRTHPGRSYRAAGVSAALVVLLAADYYGYARHRGDDDLPPSAARWVAPETGAGWTPEAFGGIRNSADLVVCTEELACEYLLARADYLLATRPDDAAHYVVGRRGEARGFYADRPPILRPAELEALVRRRPRGECITVVALRTGKVAFGEYVALVESLSAVLRVSRLRQDERTYAARLCAP